MRTCSPAETRPADAHAGEQAEVLAVRGGQVLRAARATSPACPGRAWGSRSARTGRPPRAARRPRARSPRRPSRAPPRARRRARGGGWCGSAARRPPCPARRESAASVAATVTSTVPGTSGMPPVSRSSRTGRPRSRSSAERRCGSPQRQWRTPAGSVTIACGGLRRVQPGVQVERVGRAPGEQAAAPRAPSAGARRPCARAARRGSRSPPTPRGPRLSARSSSPAIDFTGQRHSRLTVPVAMRAAR